MDLMHPNSAQSLFSGLLCPQVAYLTTIGYFLSQILHVRKRVALRFYITERLSLFSNLVWEQQSSVKLTNRDHKTNTFVLGELLHESSFALSPLPFQSSDMTLKPASPLTSDSSSAAPWPPSGPFFFLLSLSIHLRGVDGDGLGFGEVETAALGM